MFLVQSVLWKVKCVDDILQKPEFCVDYYKKITENNNVRFIFKCEIAPETRIMHVQRYMEFTCTIQLAQENLTYSLLGIRSRDQLSNLCCIKDGNSQDTLWLELWPSIPDQEQQKVNFRRISSEEFLKIRMMLEILVTFQ